MNGGVSQYARVLQSAERDNHFARRRSEYAAMNFDAISRYWTDREYRQRIDAETAHQRAITNARYDVGMAPLNERQAAMWADEEIGT